MTRRDVVIRAVLAAVVAGAGLAATVVLAWSAGMTVRDQPPPPGYRRRSCRPRRRGGRGLAGPFRRAPIAVQAAVVIVSTVGAGASGVRRGRVHVPERARSRGAGGSSSPPRPRSACSSRWRSASRSSGPRERFVPRRFEWPKATWPPPFARGHGRARRAGSRPREMSRRLEEARRRERAVEESRRELVAWISHDLRTRCRRSGGCRSARGRGPGGPRGGRRGPRHPSSRGRPSGGHGG
jgi:hypothetical protein